MALTIHAVFDGQVLRPEESAGLQPNQRYLLSVEEDARRAERCQEEPEPYPLSTLLSAAADLGVADLAERHDHYARRR
jgi:hypothetical protein